MNAPVYIGLLDRDGFFLKRLLLLLCDCFSSKNSQALFIDESEVNMIDAIFYESSKSMDCFIVNALRTSN